MYLKLGSVAAHPGASTSGQACRQSAGRRWCYEWSRCRAWHSCCPCTISPRPVGCGHQQSQWKFGSQSCTEPSTPGAPSGLLPLAARLHPDFLSLWASGLAAQPLPLPPPPCSFTGAETFCSPGMWNCSPASHRVVVALLVDAATLAEGHTGGSAQDVTFLALTALCTGQRCWAVSGGIQAEAGGGAGVGTGAVAAAGCALQS